MSRPGSPPHMVGHKVATRPLHIRTPLGIPSFHDGANCRGREALFFSTKESRREGRTKAEREAMARAICAECPVKAACMEWILNSDAQENRAADGMWAGLTYAERAKIRTKTREQLGITRHWKSSSAERLAG